MPNVLLFGGHGKIAQRLTPLLLARSHNVVSVVRNPAHSAEIERLATGHPGNLRVLVSSLDYVHSDADASAVLDETRPDWVVWSAGAGGKGGPARTAQIDEHAAKHFISAAFSRSFVRKFLLVSHLGSRRHQPPWMTADAWAHISHVNTQVLPAYYRAKLEADEFLTAHAAARLKTDPDFQTILLRPGLLTDDGPESPATGRVELGRTHQTGGNVSRGNVARVAEALLEREDTRGWLDVLDGDVPVEEAVQRVVSERVDAVEGEDVQAMRTRFGV